MVRRRVRTSDGAHPRGRGTMTLMRSQQPPEEVGTMGSKDKGTKETKKPKKPKK